MKMSAVDRAIGKGFSQIHSDKVYENYGRLTKEQIAAALAGNRAVQDLWKSLYDMYEM